MKKIILFMVFLIFSACVYVIYNFPPYGKDYDKEVYSVVIYNQTDRVFNNISIVCGRDVKIPETVEVVGKVNDLHPKEYRKINISTSKPPQRAEIPYNVSVVLEDFGIYEAAGYFGIETGGLAMLSIVEDEDTILLNRVYKHEHLFKKVERRHNQNQNELSWY